MTLEDLKVENASVRVSNGNEMAAPYKISASFQTRDGKLVRIEGGSVTKDMVRIAEFWSSVEGSPSTSMTFYEEAYGNVAVQNAVSSIINEFIEMAAAKTMAETNE